jgi:hypothetical protein
MSAAGKDPSHLAVVALHDDLLAFEGQPIQDFPQVSSQLSGRDGAHLILRYAESAVI